MEAAGAMRDEAERLGAEIRWGLTVEGLLSDDEGRAKGVRVSCVGTEAVEGVERVGRVEEEELRADVVILAAGRSLAGSTLGADIPMLDRPGALALARPGVEGQAGEGLSKIFVGTFRFILNPL